MKLSPNHYRRKFIFSSLASMLAGALSLSKTLNTNALEVGDVKAFFKRKKNAQAVKADAKLGINLAGLADWGTEFPFVNLMHTSRDWVSQPKEGAWGSGPKLQLDEHGWIKYLEAGCHAEKTLCSLDSNQIPKGEYLVFYEGEGEMRVYGLPLLKNKSGQFSLKVNGKKNGLTIEIVKTNPQNYIRNIRVIMPGFEKIYADNPWHPAFLKRWSGIACLRFMDFMQTNNSTQVAWQNRPKLQDASYAKKGVPVELMVDLATRLNTDAWFCMPHLADDDYIKAFATMVNQQLKPELKAWVEYSNEVWNGGFKQHDYAAKLGKSARFSLKEWETAWKYNAFRSVQIFDIWNEVYGKQGQARIVRVLSSQAVSDYASTQILDFNEAANHADVLAIAPYLSFIIGTQTDNALNDKAVARWSLDQLFTHLNQAVLPEYSYWLSKQAKVANEYGLKLVAYESGQHLVGVGGAENDEKLNDLFYRANADARMGELYTQSLSLWTKLGGDLNCSYCSVSSWSKWGSWGLLQYYNDSAKSAPKFMACIQWAISRKQKMAL